MVAQPFCLANSISHITCSEYRKKDSIVRHVWKFTCLTFKEFSTSQGWKDGSAVKSTGCSSRIPVFNSQHPNASPKLFITSVPRDLTPSHRQACRKSTNAQTIKINKSFKRERERENWVPLNSRRSWNPAKWGPNHLGDHQTHHKTRAKSSVAGSSSSHAVREFLFSAPGDSGPENTAFWKAPLSHCGETDPSWCISYPRCFSRHVRRK